MVYSLIYNNNGPLSLQVSGFSNSPIFKRLSSWFKKYVSVIFHSYQFDGVSLLLFLCTDGILFSGAFDIHFILLIAIFRYFHFADDGVILKIEHIALLELKWLLLAVDFSVTVRKGRTIWTSAVMPDRIHKSLLELVLLRFPDLADANI